jgi:hypothetical protein
MQREGEGGGGEGGEMKINMKVEAHARTVTDAAARPHSFVTLDIGIREAGTRSQSARENRSCLTAQR